MLALWIELILSLSLTASSLSFLPRRAQYHPDDNGETDSSAHSPLESGTPDRGRTPNPVITLPNSLAASFPFGHSRHPLPLPPLPETANYQWATFQGLQRRRESLRTDLPRQSPGFQVWARPVAPAAGFPRQSRPEDRGEGAPAPVSPGGPWRNRKKAGSLQVQKPAALGLWEPAPNLAKRGVLHTRPGSLDLDTKEKFGHQRPFRQSAEDLPTGQGAGDEVWGSGSGHTEHNFEIKRKSEARGWDPSVPLTRHDAETRQRTAEEAWRRLTEKGQGVTEVIALPLTEHEATRSNCRTVPFTQNISHPNCKTSAFQNRLCFGQCSSFFIPGAEQRLYRSCSRCFPSQLRRDTVQLECEGGLLVSKEVTLVEKCQCDLEKAGN